jgi:hypothetical protein
MKKNSTENKLVDKIISSLDWDSILEVNKCFKLGVGEGSSVIPGIKRKVFSPSLNKNDIKSELKTLLKYAIENDIAELFYGPWMIFWSNGEWVKVEFDQIEDDDEDDSFSDINTEIDLLLDSTLEVIYSPQRIMVSGNSPHLEVTQENSDTVQLENMLKKALASENYEVANKIKEILDLQNIGGSKDK